MAQGQVATDIGYMMSVEKQVLEISARISQHRGRIRQAAEPLVNGLWRGEAADAARPVVADDDVRSGRLVLALNAHNESVARYRAGLQAQEGNAATAIRGTGTVGGTPINTPVV